MQVRDCLTVVTKSPKEYELLRALIDTYEYFTQLGTSAQWLGFDEVTGLYTAIFDYEGTDIVDKENRKNDILDIVDYIKCRSYPIV